MPVFNSCVRVGERFQESHESLIVKFGGQIRFFKINSSKLRLQQPSGKGPSRPSYKYFSAPCTINIFSIYIYIRWLKHTRYQVYIILRRTIVNRTKCC